jgi:hypothetical protein
MMIVSITLEIRDNLKKGDRVSHLKTGSMGTVDRDELNGGRAVVKWDSMPDDARLRATRKRNLVRHITISG